MEQVVAELAALNKKADTIISIMNKPENQFMRVLGIVGTVITVMSILSIVDIMRQWLGF
ncbi:MAG: hypothetical protein LBH44_09475 [Treponema sp.]|jgi:Mg2+ and Co2+ transporter CorA|nr:hypothetical protein [Treponema sp.]